MRRPVLMETRFMYSGRVGQGLVLIIVDGFVLRGRDVAAPGVRPPVGPPVDVLEAARMSARPSILLTGHGDYVGNSHSIAARLLSTYLSRPVSMP